ncbi:hypothetical protein A5893_15340 [Pedobacter psychrophilus]|uniref:Lipoprotein n=1 Tax=Pedobacter psychrophilus TaxID=1826909 RepID=A0A179DAU4_9SPHI|nr:hypothetical protein [Pedobacter psychrophilus]OAQ38171.1 hypothetical protein A5893_15340 [Pedobacter psychrophilus]
MKNKLFTGFVALLSLAACNQNQKKDAPAEYPVNDPQLGNVTTDTSAFKLSNDEQCFMAHLKKDSAFLSLREENGEIKGKLWYKFAEKDNSKGDLTGKLDKDTLKLNYTFASEGVKGNEMPIKLSYKNGNLYEVYGDKPAEEGKGFIYVKSDCRNF